MYNEIDKKMNKRDGDFKRIFHSIEKDAPWHLKRYAKLSKKILHCANMEHISRGEWSMFSDEMEHDLTYHGASFQSLWHILFQTSQRAVCTILLLVGILQVHPSNRVNYLITNTNESLDDINVDVELGDVYMNFGGQAYITWSQVENLILSKLNDGKGMTKQDFEKYYRFLDENEHWNMPTNSDGALYEIAASNKFWGQRFYFNAKGEIVRAANYNNENDAANKFDYHKWTADNNWFGRVWYTPHDNATSANCWDESTSVLIWDFHGYTEAVDTNDPYVKSKTYAGNMMNAPGIPALYGALMSVAGVSYESKGLSTKAISTVVRFVNKDTGTFVNVKLIVPAGKLHFEYGDISNKDWSRWFEFNTSNGGSEDFTKPFWKEFDAHINPIKPANNSYQYLNVTSCNQLLTDNWLNPTQMVVFRADKDKFSKFYTTTAPRVSFIFTLPVKDVNSKEVSAVNGQWVVEGASGTKWTLKLAAHNGVDNTAIVAVAKNGTAYGPEEVCYLDDRLVMDGVIIAQNNRIHYHGLETSSNLYPAATDLINKVGTYDTQYLSDNIDKTFTAYLQLNILYDLSYNPLIGKTMFNVRFLRPINVAAKSFEWDDSSISDNRIPIKDLVEIVDWNQKPVVAYNSEKIDASKTVFGITQPAYSTVYNNANSMKQQNEGIPYEYYGISDLAVCYDEIRTDYDRAISIRQNTYYDAQTIISNTDLVKDQPSLTSSSNNLKTVSLINADGSTVSYTKGHAYNHSDLNATGKGTQFGWLYYNSGSESKMFHIYVPIAIKYNWGNIANDYLLDSSGTKLDNNYTQTVWAVITVPAKELPATVTATSYTIEYGDAIPKLEYTSEGGELSGTPQLKCEATSTSPVGTYPIVITKGSVQNNSVTYVNGTLTITKAPLTIAAKSYTRKQGEANPAFEVTYSGFKNNETSSVLTKLPTVSTTATESSSPGKYDITVSGAEARNYSMDYVKGTLTVTEADPITVTALNYTREYGDDNPNFDFTVSGATLNGTPTITCSATKNSPVGTYPIKISQGSVSNYNVTYVDGTLTITKAPLTITAQSYTRKQGEDNPTFEVTYSGFKNNETSSVLAKQPTVSTTATKDSRVGTYDITVSGAEAQNYDISYVKGTLTVTQADAIVVTATSYTREYGDDNSAFEYTTSGGTLNGTPKITCSATKTSPVGTYTIKIEQGSVSNYNVTYVEGTLTITKAPLTITAKSYTRKQGEANPTFDVTYSDFKNDETSSVLTKKPTCSTTATKDSPVGTYDITVSGAEAQNYDISYVKGTLTVTQADAIVVTATSYTREYGDDNPTFDYSASGGKLNGTPKISCSATKTSPVGTYTIKIDKGSVTNSNVTYLEGTLTITKAPLTITAKSYTREEGQDNPTFEVTYDGFKNNETSSVLTQMPTVTTAATANSPAGTYDITVYGAEAQNYSISYVKGTLTVTESKPISFTRNGITYSGAKSTLTAIVLSVDNNLMNVEIPSSVIYDGITYQVTSIASGALSNHTFNYVSLPSTITSVETGIFNNSIMSALIWNADASLSSSVFSNMAMPTTSNFLLYVNSESYAPLNVSNVIVGSTSNSITLVDARSANNFYCPQEFTAQSISYSHNYNMTSGLNESRGWETIALPFDVQKVTHSSKGEILPFAKWKSGYLQKPFWLMELTNSGWTAAESIKANTPYIISMPNNQEYKAGFQLNGCVTFSAENVKVHKTDNLHPAVFESKTFVPNFALKESDVYVLNVVNDLEQNRGDATEGSTFIWNLRPVHPFEAYMTTTQATRSIPIDDAMPTGIDCLVLTNDGSEEWYDLQGRRVKQPAKGVYIRNSKKLIIR